jgi:hypothetical protein
LPIIKISPLDLGDQRKQKMKKINRALKYAKGLKSVKYYFKRGIWKVKNKKGFTATFFDQETLIDYLRSHHKP